MTNNEDEEFEFRARVEKEGQQKPSLLSRGLGSYMAMMGKEGGYGSNPAGKLFSMVQKPFQKAGEATATGIAKNFPRIPPQIPAGIGTAMQMIPDVALQLGGKPSVPASGPGKMLRGAFGQLESSSGSMPGSLEAAYKDPSLIFGKGREAAKPLYEAAQDELKNTNVWKGQATNGVLEMEQGGQNVFKAMPENIRIVRRARQMIDAGKKLEPAEALTARKAVDAVKHSKAYSPDFLFKLRSELDAAAKESPNIAKADPLYRRGMTSESLRNVMPQNKYGGASAFKMGIVPALSGLGGFVAGHPGAAAGAAVGGAALSPVVQGAGATAMGIGSRTDPRIISALLQLMRSRQQNEDTNP